MYLYYTLTGILLKEELESEKDKEKIQECIDCTYTIELKVNILGRR